MKGSWKGFIRPWLESYYCLLSEMGGGDPPGGISPHFARPLSISNSILRWAGPCEGIIANTKPKPPANCATALSRPG